MAVTNIYGERTLRAVSMPVGSLTAYYVFKTNVDASEVTELGQVAASTLAGNLENPAAAPVFVGTAGNGGRPRPGRLKKKKEKITSLASSANIQTAIATKKWQIVKRPVYKGKQPQKVTTFGTPIPGGNAAKGSVLVVVSTGGFDWAWRMMAQQFNKITSAEATGLGITIPNTDAEFKRLLVNANLPRPARASRTLETADGILQIETFIGDAATLPAGWTGVGEALKFIG
jgi:hypothetical protein